MKPNPYLRWSLWTGLLLVGLGAMLGGYRWQQRTPGIEAMALPAPLAMAAVYQQAYARDTFCTPQPGWSPPEGFDLARFLAPESTDRPWVEWYWPGTALPDLKLAAGVQAIYEAGWGGIALQPTTWNLPNDSLQQASHPYLGYDQPAYYRQLQLLLKLVQRRGLQLDLPLGDGAPSGGTHLGPTDHPKTLAVGEAFLYGGKTIELPLPAPRPSVSQALAGLTEERQKAGKRSLMDPLAVSPELVAVLAAKVARDHRSPRIWQLTDSLTLRPDSLQVLTHLVDSQGCLHWEAPPGPWLVLAFYAQPSGQRPGGSAQPGPGLVVDLLDSTSVLGHAYFLTRPATGLAATPSPALRGWTYQAGPWRNSRWFHPDLLADFEADHGYDLVPQLPVLCLPGADDEPLRQAGLARRPEFVLSSADAGVRRDYAATLSQRLQTQGLGPLDRWMNRRGWALRSRIDGNYDPIGLAGRLSLPEASQAFAGGTAMALKLAVSGASLHGRSLVSCRAFGQTGMAYRQDPHQMKVNLDHLLVQGFNHLVYAGRAAPAAGLPHWWPLAGPQPVTSPLGTDLGRGQPFTQAMAQLNRYVARCQYVLRQGQPQREVLVYFPWARFPADFARDTLHREWLFRGELPGLEAIPLPSANLPEGQAELSPATAWLRSLWPMLEELENQGISWDWTNDAMLQQSRWESGRLLVGTQSYQRLLLPAVEHLPLATAERVVALAGAGLPVLRLGETLPTQVPGFDPTGEKGAQLRHLMAQLAGPQGLERPSGLANHLVGYPPRQSLRFAGRYPFLRQTRRVDAQGNTWMFLVNRAAETRFFDLTVDDEFRAFYWLDPWEGRVVAAKPDQQSRLRGRLPAYGSAMLLASQQTTGFPDSLLSEVQLTLAEVAPTSVINHQALERWDLLVAGEDVAGETLLIRDTSLFAWTEHPRLRYVASEGVYTHSFFLGDTLPGRRYLLDLGELHGMAELSLNTEPVAMLLNPPYQVDLTARLSPGFNTLELWLTPPRLNRLVGWGKAGKPGFAAFANQEAWLIPNGLLGPVVLWELKAETQSPLFP